MIEIAKSMRTEELNKRSLRRTRLLKEMENLLACESEELPPQEVEVSAMLRLGRCELGYQNRMAHVIYAQAIERFHKRPWWQRIWIAYRKQL